MKIAKGAKFVPMTPEEIDEARTALESGAVGVEEWDILHSQDRDHTFTSWNPRTESQPRQSLPTWQDSERGLQHEANKHLLVGGATAAVAPGVRCSRRGGARRRSGAPSRRMAPARSPFSQAAAESYERKYSGARVVVGVSGTGGGFERFCKNETDLSNASRPIRLSRLPGATTPGSATSSSSWPTTASRSS